MSEFLHRDEFEQYLQKKAGQLRMYPNDKVWRNIRKNLHGDSQWPGMSAISFIVVAALITGTLLVKPRPDILNSNYHFSLQSPGFKTIGDSKETTADFKNITEINEHFSAYKITRNTLLAVSEKLKQEEIFYSNSTGDVIDKNAETIKPSVTSVIEQDQTLIAENYKPSLVAERKQTVFSSTMNFDLAQFRFRKMFDKLSKDKQISLLSRIPDFSSDGNIDKPIQLPISKDDKSSTQKKALDKLKNKSSRFEFRFYVTPAVSYRILNHKNDVSATDMKPDAGIAPIEANYNIDPKKAINQRPAIGYETGFGLGYKLSNKISVTGGAQFNISQYNVDAYLYKNEEPTQVTLEENGVKSTYTSYSNVRSISGNDAVTFKTRYYQASIPVGVDFRVVNFGNFTWGIAATLQPTYTFDKLPLIISSNFKNYTDGSRFIRNWNFNTGLETYISYTSGSYRWQLGPQFRYQWLPSLENQYPTKEYMFNAGIKLGVVKYLKQQ